MIQTNNSFSWRRTAMVARYYYPMLKPQIILYPIVALLTQILVYVAYFTEPGIIIASMLSMLLSATVSFGALIFTYRSNRVLETMLPATWAEKSVVIIGYCIVVMPMLTIGVSAAVCGIMTALWGEPTYMKMISHITEQFSTYSMLTQLQQLVPVSTCMFCVVALRHNRLRAIAWTILSLFILGLFGGLAGAYAAFSAGLEAGSSGIEPDPEAVANNIIAIITPMFKGIIVATVGYAVMMIYLTARKISKIQI